MVSKKSWTKSNYRSRVQRVQDAGPSISQPCSSCCWSLASAQLQGHGDGEEGGLRGKHRRQVKKNCVFQISAFLTMKSWVTALVMRLATVQIFEYVVFKCVMDVFDLPLSSVSGTISLSGFRSPREQTLYFERGPPLNMHKRISFKVTVVRGHRGQHGGNKWGGLFNFHSPLNTRCVIPLAWLSNQGICA